MFYFITTPQLDPKIEGYNGILSKKDSPTWDPKTDPQLIPGNPNFNEKKFKKLQEFQKNSSPLKTVVNDTIDKGLSLFKDTLNRQLTVFDLVNTSENGKWTVSKFQNFENNLEQIPHVVLTEYKVRSSSTIQSLRVAVAAFGDIPNIAEDLVPDAISKILKKFITGNPISDATLSALESANKALGQVDQPTLDNDSHLDNGRYNNLYSVDPTGYSYILPYFSESYFTIANNWSDSSKTSSNLAKKTDSWADAGIAAMNSPGYWDPGIYIERPKFYNFNYANEVEISVNFPLINTHKFEDVDKNLQLIKNLVIQNLPYRKSIVRNEIPVIYDVVIPGVAHHPFCFIKRLDIKHLGNKRITKEFNNNEPMLIPDAYMVNITLVSLVLNAANFYLKAFGSNINGIDVETHLSPAAKPAAPAAPNR